MKGFPHFFVPFFLLHFSISVSFSFKTYASVCERPVVFGGGVLVCVWHLQCTQKTRRLDLRRTRASHARTSALVDPSAHTENTAASGGGARGGGGRRRCALRACAHTGGGARANAVAARAVHRPWPHHIDWFVC